MHFDARVESQKLILELIGSANDICVEYGICAHLGDQKDDVESRHDSASDCCFSQSLWTYKLIPSFCDRQFLLLRVVSGAEPLSKGVNT